MAEEQRCSKCGSADLVPNVRILDFYHGNWSKRELTVEVQERPAAILFKNAHRCTVSAVVCGRCGFAELFVTEPANLLQAYRQQCEQDK